MSTALAVEHRNALDAINLLSEKDQAAIWAKLSGLSADEVRDALMELIPALAEKYGSMAGSIAADFYDAAREQAAVRGRFFASPADVPTRARFEAMVRWGVDPLYSGAPDRSLAQSLLVGAVQRVVANVSRDTVTTNTERDPAATGWRRVARGDGCSFCRMLADRGDVYKQSTAGFSSHERCHCAASPAFDNGHEVGVVQYVASKRNKSEKDRARVRDYLKDNYSTSGA